MRRNCFYDIRGGSALDNIEIQIRTAACDLQSIHPGIPYVESNDRWVVKE